MVGAGGLLIGGGKDGRYREEMGEELGGGWADRGEDMAETETE